MDAETVAASLRRYETTHRDERELQEALAGIFERAGIPATAEVMLGPGCRIDFLVDRVGIEVKVDGAPAAVRRQLVRYLECDAVDEVLLVTTRAAHRALAGPLAGKRVGVLVMGRP